MKNLAKQDTLLLIFLSILLFSCSESGDVSINSLAYYDESFSPTQGDEYAEFEENPFIDVSENPVSTFSIDADGASYANVRRFIQQDQSLPPKAAVRTEELINYFDLDYEFDHSGHPIALNGEVAECPWKDGNKLVRIGIQGEPISENDLPASNFVFLIDVSGSMSSGDKLELLKEGFTSFVEEMNVEDRIAIVTYASSSGVVLESTSGSQKSKINEAINALGSGGGTAGAEGIITAYEIAEKNFIEEGNNRIIMGTDGDFNIGVSNRDSLISLIERKRESGVYLTILGVGRGNLNDASLEQIANNGNGTFEYVDNVKQLMKVFIFEKNKFYTAAKDVKVQVRFDPSLVSSYRLIGYENRLLSTEEFEDDTKDAGEIGRGQNITALYEIVPQSSIAQARTSPTFAIDFRYKLPSDNSKPLELKVFDSWTDFNTASDQMKFVTSVAAFSMLITDSQHKGASSYDKVIDWLDESNLSDENGFKAEFRELVLSAKRM